MLVWGICRFFVDDILHFDFIYFSSFFLSFVYLVFRQSVDTIIIILIFSKNNKITWFNCNILQYSVVFSTYYVYRFVWRCTKYKKTRMARNLSWWTMLIMYLINGGLILHSDWLFFSFFFLYFCGFSTFHVSGWVIMLFCGGLWPSTLQILVVDHYVIFEVFLKMKYFTLTNVYGFVWKWH